MAGGVFLLPVLPITFLPPSPPSYIQIDLELPPGTGITRTFAELNQVEEVLDDFIREGAVAAYQVTLGAPQITSGPGANATGFEFATFTVSPPAEFPEDLEERVRAALPQSDDVVLTITAATSTSVPSKMQLTVSGPKFTEVSAVTRQLETGVRGIDGLINISSDVSARKDEVIISPDLRDAAKFGLATQDVARQMNLYVGGRKVTDVNFEGIDMDVVLRAQPEDVDSIDKVRSLPVEGALDRVKLGFIADVGIRQGPTTISRRDGNRSATLTGLGGG